MTTNPAVSAEPKPPYTVPSGMPATLARGIIATDHIVACLLLLTGALAIGWRPRPVETAVIAGVFLAERWIMVGLFWLLEWATDRRAEREGTDHDC